MFSDSQDGQTPSMHFDLADFRLLVHIAEANSLTGGAERAHLSLPAASMRIKNLEESLGLKLFTRTNRGVCLTPAGQVFLNHARQVLGQLENLCGDLLEYANGVKGQVRIFANTTSTEFLPEVLRTYLARHPNVNVELRERLSQEIVRAVTEGMADIGIVAGNVRTEGLEALPYRRDRLVLAVAPAHPLAAKPAADFAETLDYGFIGLTETSAIHGFLVEAATRLNRRLKIRIQVGNFTAVCRMIEADIGIGILPESAARRHAKSMNIRLIRLNDEWAKRDLQICVRSLDLLPVFGRDLVELLLADAAAAERQQ